MNTKTLVAAALATGLLAPMALFAADSHPVVDFQAGYLLGSSAANKWLQPDSLVRSKTLPGPKKYRVYSMIRYLGEASGAKAAPQGPPCEETRYVDFSPKPEAAKYKSGVLAIAGSWNALPRVPRQENTNQPTYRAVIAKMLKAKGIANPTVRIAQVWRVDLEGDDVDEVLINATNHQGSNGLNGSISPDSKAGEYSMIVLRKIVKGNVQTHLIEGAFYPVTKTFNAPSVFRLLGTFDVNGDGKMEVVTKGRYYEGDWTTIYTIGNSGPKSVLKVQEVLSEGCGA